MDDSDLLRQFWERDEAALGNTAEKYGPYCSAIALRILHSRENAEECVNDTWLGAWNAIPPSKPARLAVFLGRITRNIALDRSDYNHAGKRSREMEVILSELGDCLTSGDSVAGTLEEGETAGAISAFLWKQKPEARKVFLRRYWYAQPVKVIARELNLGESKVKSMLHRTRLGLRAHLIKEGITL